MKGSMDKKRSSSMKGKQGRKDSRTRRVNYDNTRLRKFDSDVDRDDIDVRDTKRTCKSNDVRWYALNDQLLKSAASIPFSEVTGTPVASNPNSVAGVMQLYWVPFVGGNNNAINQAANQIYSFTVHANSRNQSYDPSDEMLLIIAGAQVFSAIANGLRAYGLMRRYMQQDIYTPSAILKSMSLDYQDLKRNYSRMWFDLNQLIAQSRQIWIPNTLPLIERWFWMNSNVYMDGSSIKSQYYVFDQAVFYQYDETSSVGGGSLVPVTKPTTWNAYVSMVQNMIDALINSQDRGIIFGDILKAYGSDKIYSLGEVGPDYELNIVYDREVLSQIENANFFPAAGTDIDFIGQDTNNNNRLFQAFKKTAVKVPTAGTSVTVPAAQSICNPRYTTLNFHQLDVPTPEQVMVATRLKNMGIASAGISRDGFVCVMPALAGTEVLIACSTWFNNWATGAPILSEGFNSPLFSQQPSATIQLNATQWMNYLAFDWPPALTVATASAFTVPDYRPGASVNYSEYVMELLDYDNYTVLTDSELSKMHTTAVYSEFGVPSFTG